MQRRRNPRGRKIEKWNNPAKLGMYRHTHKENSTQLLKRQINCTAACVLRVMSTHNDNNNLISMHFSNAVLLLISVQYYCWAECTVCTYVHTVWRCTASVQNIPTTILLVTATCAGLWIRQRTLEPVLRCRRCPTLSRLHPPPPPSKTYSASPQPFFRGGASP